MKRYDAIVVGAGPAGSTAAYRMAQEGISVLLIDKARFPRDKPCGGGLSIRALRQLPLDVAPVVEDRVERFEFTFRHRGRFIRAAPQGLACMTQRRRLDHFLVEQAVAGGVELRDGAAASEISERGTRLGRERLGCELVIAADGANGAAARSLGLDGQRVYGVALEGNISHRHLDPERWRGAALIELASIPGGYGWIFPKADHVNVGVGGWESEGPKLRTLLMQLCKRHSFDPSQLEGLRGHRLPARRAHAALARGRALVVGDAAGLIDPLWADGLFTALLSARLAANAAHDLLTGRAASLQPYAESVLAELGPTIAFAWNAKSAIDRFAALTASALLSPPGWRMVSSVLRGELHDPCSGRTATSLTSRLLEGLARHAAWPGAVYRAEAAEVR